MKSLRTPDDRFNDLPGYPFDSHYVDIDDLDGGTLRVHFLDEGPADGPVVLAMHGEPSWSYLYRKMIPLLTAAGLRVIAPDLVGFGKSDKPSEKSDYTYERHVAWMQAAIVDHLDLHDATFFGQDWGGLIGLRLVAENPDRFARVVVGDTGLPTGRGTPSDAFIQWQKFSQESPVFPIGQILNGATITDLSDGEVAAYDAPFPDETYKEGARIFPSLVPTSKDDPAVPANIAAWEVFKRWEKPFVTCFSDSDPITAGGDAPFLSLVPGAKGQPHVTINNAHHFFQEDGAPQIAQVVIDAVTKMRPERWSDPAKSCFPYQVGFTGPPMDFDAAPSDFLRISPPTVGAHGRLLHAPGYSHELDQRVDNFHQLEEVVHCFSNAGADVVGQVGTNWVHAGGRDVHDIRAYVAEMTDKYETPLHMAGLTLVQACEEMGYERVALNSVYFWPDWRDGVVRFLRSADIDVVWYGNFVDQGWYDDQEVVNDATWIFPGELASNSTKYAFEQAPDVDAVLVNGMSNYRDADGLPQRFVSLAADIEAEVGVPVIAADISLYWQIFRTLGVAPIGRQGSLLSSLQTAVRQSGSVPHCRRYLMEKSMFLTLWATPRSTSTAFEWMMRQRGDFVCHHEPWNELYYYGEDRVSDRDAHVEPRPGHNYASVWSGLSESAERGQVFVKDFVYSVKHALTTEMLSEITHSFLIRDPKRVVQGLAKHWPDCTWAEVGFESLHRLFNRIADRDGVAPPVMYSGDLLDDPAGTARAYCAAVGIPFIADALKWEAGDRGEVSWYGEGTGPWHDNLRDSTGIQKPKTTYPPLEENQRLFELYERAVPLFDDLRQHTLTPMPDPGS